MQKKRYDEKLAEYELAQRGLPCLSEKNARQAEARKVNGMIGGDQIMSQKRSTILIWAAVIFILIAACLITDRNNLAERTLYSSQEEMQSALQDTFVYYTARGERQAWSIHGDTAIQTYENGAVFFVYHHEMASAPRCADAHTGHHSTKGNAVCCT